MCEVHKTPEEIEANRKACEQAAVAGSATGSASPRGLGYITECPVCKSKDLKDESAFIMEGVSCRSCGWADIDAGIDSGC